jgi:hypothetical protein
MRHQHRRLATAKGTPGVASVEVEERSLPTYDRVFRLIEGGGEG